MPPKKQTGNAAASAPGSPKAAPRFTDDERAAMKDRAQELKAETRRGAGAKDADGEADLLAKIAEMPNADRVLAQRIHALIKAVAPTLTPRTWYGMPAYAADGNVLCYFQGAYKFKARYAIFGFSDKAKLDDGNLWPATFALKALAPSDEATLGALVKRALGQD